MFNVILFTDTPEMGTRLRGYGAHRLASHIRERGYTCLVVDFMSAITLDTYKEIMNYAVGKDTYMVGVSATWLPFRMTLVDPDLDETQIHDPGRTDDTEHRHVKKDQLENFLDQKMQTAMVKNQTEPWFEHVKNLNPKTKIVLGGTKIGMYTDMKMVDNLFIGYSETMVIDYLDSLSGKAMPRIWNKVIDHDQKAQAPVWDYRVSQTRYTDYDFIQSIEPLSLEVGRGCRFKCKFCSYPLIGEKNINDYLKEADVLRDELMTNYEKHGTTRYYIIDDTFNDSVQKVKYFLNVVKSLPFKISYWCYLRLDLLMAFPEMIPMLKESGLIQCYFGIETFNHKAGKAVGKGGDPDKLKQTLYECKRIWGDEVNIQAGFIVGLPYEDSESVMKTSEWLCKPDCPIDIKWIFPLSIGHGDHEVMKYTYKSEFDKNSHLYGYSIPDKKKFWEWFKDDGTDIDSAAKAEEVSLKAEKPIYNRPFKKDMYIASLPHPILSDIEQTAKMSNEEYESLIESIDTSALFTESVNETYFKPLLNKLKS